MKTELGFSACEEFQIILCRVLVQIFPCVSPRIPGQLGTAMT